MESCNNQYSNSRNHNLYIHSSNRSVRNNCNNDHCDRECCANTNIHTDRSIVSECNSTSIARLHPQWSHRNMESCNHQYSNSRNHYLYIYSGYRSVRNNSNNEYCREYCANTNVHSDRTTCVKNATAPALPGFIHNGVTGTWSPATINTATAGTTTYTFTPSQVSAEQLQQ